MFMLIATIVAVMCIISVVCRVYLLIVHFVMQPLMYGRGGAPGVAMMPMLLPDGRIGYVL